ncbi:MAG: B12-binding domain-containing radical SAM protein [Planctomycetes bacterium]|nr:B12-binding domain-containing radical SAM protein [Planctomycetota bacterium]
MLNTPARPMLVFLVGFQDQDNLGLRYLSSSVAAAGHRARIVTYSSDPRDLVRRALEERPDVVGLSLIFQYMAPEFARVVAALRAAGVRAHVTVGGHYPSFEYAEVLRGMPGLDSVVRFEGERTLVELLDCLASGVPWQEVAGIAHVGPDGDVRATPLRPPVADLDGLPWPDRADVPYEASPLATASVLGSRGCPWDCSFCSIRPFYEAQGGSLRRLRDPRRVVEEIEALHRDRRVSLFLFQDDDFLATGSRAARWATAVSDEIVARGLAGRIAFKISCRSDEVREDVVAALVRGGLTHVYMGVESGDDETLRRMNKHMGAARHVEAARILRRAGLSFDFGFMLLDPDSTFESVRRNLRFLEEFVGDGWSVANFCRMLPYAGTPVRDRLAQAGRLLGTPFVPDYRFLDARLDAFYDWTTRAFQRRNFSNEGSAHLARVLSFRVRLRLPSANPSNEVERAFAQHLVARTNAVACYATGRALDEFEGGDPDPERLADLAALVDREDRAVADRARRLLTALDLRARAPDGGFDRSWTFAARPTAVVDEPVA